MVGSILGVAHGGGFYKPSVFTRVGNVIKRRIPNQKFEFEAMHSYVQSQLSRESARSIQLADEPSWRELLSHVREKLMSPIGAELMHFRISNAMIQSIEVEDLIQNQFPTEFEDEEVDDPIFIVGLPRSFGRYMTHTFARSGYVKSLRPSDAMFPGTVSHTVRCQKAERFFRGKNLLFPEIMSIVPLDNKITGDDIPISLMNPNSYAWGLLHGLDDHLKARVHENDQVESYEQLKKVMKLYQILQRLSHFELLVDKEIEPVQHAPEIQRLGPKNELVSSPWVIHLPLSILSVPSLMKVFPKARIVWCHRALFQAIPSITSSLLLHHTAYTNIVPSQGTKIMTGRLVVDLFSSGCDQAISHWAKDRPQMYHLSNQEIRRSGVRLMEKLGNRFGWETDYWRRLQAINGFTEYSVIPRAVHQHHTSHFALNEGDIKDHFAGYIEQFEEFWLEDMKPLEKAQLSSNMQLTGMDKTKSGRREVTDTLPDVAGDIGVGAQQSQMGVDYKPPSYTP